MRPRRSHACGNGKRKCCCVFFEKLRRIEGRAMDRPGDEPPGQNTPGRIPCASIIKKISQQPNILHVGPSRSTHIHTYSLRPEKRVVLRFKMCPKESVVVGIAALSRSPAPYLVVSTLATSACLVSVPSTSPPCLPPAPDRSPGRCRSGDRRRGSGAPQARLRAP
jgi:hypothetical protein